MGVGRAVGNARATYSGDRLPATTGTSSARGLPDRTPCCGARLAGSRRRFPLTGAAQPHRLRGPDYPAAACLPTLRGLRTQVCPEEPHVMIKRSMLVALALLVTGCPASEEPAPTPAPTAAAKATPPPKPTPEPIDRSAYHPALLDPAQATETAPAKYAVKLETTKGDMIIDVTRDWSPNGADRFYNLVKIGYFQDVAFFRVIGGFMAQTGIHGDPQVNDQWRNAKIEDDEVKESNQPGFVSFATAGPNTRTVQFFMNFKDNKNLDGMGFSPFGKLRDMGVLNTIYNGYGEGAPRGRGPRQDLLQSKGNAYLKAEFPEMDYIKGASILE
jgi:peptidyl-prolyl cis-trans isomerase A (cyclophilin A)